jgi:hypothetical protein
VPSAEPRRHWALGILTIRAAFHPWPFFAGKMVVTVYLLRDFV